MLQTAGTLKSNFRAGSVGGEADKTAIRQSTKFNLQDALAYVSFVDYGILIPKHFFTLIC